MSDTTHRGESGITSQPDTRENPFRIAVLQWGARCKMMKSAGRRAPRDSA